jgi:phage terminase large subunit
MTITCKLNGRQIFFKGLDDPEKIKSIKPKKGPISDIIVEEATECTYKAVKQLLKRQRGKSTVPKRLTMLFNPILKDHWIYKEYFLDNWEDDKQYVETSRLSILHTTYKDNKFLSEEDINDLENESDRYYYEVYTLGKWGILGAVIFKNWKVEDFSDIESTFDNYHNGVDWGFGTDPFAFGRCHLDLKRKKLYICREIYATGLSNDESGDLIKDVVEKEKVTCDSAEPKSVNDYRKKHIYAVSAKKGPGSIEYGIKFLQSLEIIIHPRCQNAKNEFSKYKYKEDRMGNVLPIPVDKDNHLIDAIRYSLEDYSMDKTLKGA